MNYYSLLFDYCRWKIFERILDLFALAEKSGEIIDILHHDGQILSIVFEDNSHEIMRVLMEYYQKNIIAKAASDEDRDEAVSRLTKILDRITEDEEISDEMREALGPYLDEDLVHEKHSDTTESMEFDEADAIAASHKDVDTSEIFSSATGGSGIVDTEVTGDSDG